MNRLLYWWCRRYHVHAHFTVYAHLGRSVHECKVCKRTFVTFENPEGEKFFRDSA